MIFHCTKKLYTKLPVNTTINAAMPTSIGLQAKWLNWHANLITIQRRQCVIAVHDATRYAVFIPCLTKSGFAKLQWHFEDVFINSLLKSGLPHELVETATQYLAPLQFDTECNRSVQGTMNQIAQDIDYGLSYANAAVSDISPYRYSAELSHRPCTIKGLKDYQWPDKAMAELLSNLQNKG